jgi:hypothetical protein
LQDGQRLLDGSAFVELAPLLDRQPSLLAQGLHSLRAAKVGAGGDSSDLEPSQERRQTGCLPEPLLVERP